MDWLIVALVAYFILALANLLDKFLVEKILASARAYTFMASVMGLLIFAIAPWFLNWPGWLNFFFNIFLGFLFSLALFFLYAALRKGEASRVLVIVGGSTPVFSAPLALIILKDALSFEQVLAICFLLIGLLFLFFLPKTKKNFWEKLWQHWSIENNFSQKAVYLALLSALAYALFFVGSKFAYIEQDFLSAFLWTRLGAALFAAFFLFSRKARQEIIKLFRRKPGNSKKQLLLVFNQSLGAIGFILQNYAIFLGPVALVNALQGVQYAWIIILSTLISIFAPKIFKEDLSKNILLQKILAVIIISVGLYILII
ncbi:MAG: EamA family transporter [Patescibacteria group bacterium]|jgi:drug/metabolite transporter (DMT)-like permease|nr:EamA family transporter [Patescibacteria group bacterium]